MLLIGGFIAMVFVGIPCIICFLWYLKTNNKLWLIPPSIVGILAIAFLIIPDLSKPIRLMKEDVIGKYQIDTNFYPGKNARWQFDHYSFEITKQDSFLFSIKGARTKIVLRNTIIFNDPPPFIFRLQQTSPFHILKEPPTLVRKHSWFYYIFHSEKFGNMFFRKRE